MVQYYLSLRKNVDLINKLEEDLEKGVRKVESWADSVGVNIIEMKFNKKDPFFNINTREDLGKANGIKFF